MLELPRSTSTHLTKIQIFSYDSAENIKRDFRDVLKLPTLKLFNTPPKKKKERLDAFFFDKMAVGNRYPSFAKFLKLILCLSHGQGSIERGFSHNETALQTNVSDVTVVSRRLIIDHMVTKQIKAHQITADSKLRSHARAISIRHRLYKKEMDKKDKAEKDLLEKKLIKEDWLELKEIIKVKQDEIIILQKEADTLSERGDKENRISLFKAGQEVKRRVKVQQKSLEELQGRLKDIERKMKK